MLRYASVVVLAAGLTGCGAMPFDYDDGGDHGRPVSGSLATSIPPSMAMAAVPITAGQVVSVIERKRTNALQHEITLQGAPPNFGSNQVTVTAFRYVDTIPEKPGEDMVAMAKPSDEDITKEMQERFPGGALELSPNVPRNGMGPFGYAFGRRNGASCIYAWQYIEAGYRPFNAVSNKSAAPVSVRVRICRPGMTEEVMVDFVRQMYVQPRTTGTAYQPAGPMAAAPMAAPALAGAPMAAPLRRPDALAAAGGVAAGATYGGYAPAYASGPMVNPYAQPVFTGGYGYNPAYAQQAQPAPQQAAPVRKVAAAPKKVIRRIVRRRVIAPQVYSSAPVQQAAPVVQQAAPGGYSAVPMPQ